MQTEEQLRLSKKWKNKLIPFESQTTKTNLTVYEKNFNSYLLFLISNLSSAQTQLEMNAAAKTDYQKADKELNFTYKKNTALTWYLSKTLKSRKIFGSNFVMQKWIWNILKKNLVLRKCFSNMLEYLYGRINPKKKQRIKNMVNWNSNINQSGYG